jgi:predicted outer membrane repeat protein
MVLSPVVAASASAAGTTWYAYADGGAMGTPSTCAETTTTSQQCTLAEALAGAAAGDTVFLATPGGSGTGEADYVGNWSVSTSGTSPPAPLTIEPANGVANPTLDGNGGSGSSPCSTSACNGSILTVSNSAFLVIDGVMFQNADNTSAAPYGGAIQNDAGGSLTVTGSAFTGNTASDGGAVANGYAGTGTLNISGSTFSANTATADGGAISSGEQPGSTATLVVTGSTFSDNKATNDDGGAIDSGDYQATGTLTVTNSTFSNNAAQYDGGAIDSSDDSGNGSLSVLGATFSANTADWGGAIDNGDTVGAGTLTISGSTFTGNSVSTDGGAIDNGDGGGTGTLTITGSTLSGNYANADGGAIDSGDTNGTGALTATNSTFSGNSAGAHNGGAIDSGDNGGTGTLTVAGSTFSDNASGAGTGGAINSGDASGTGTLSVSASTFSANSASGSGGAIDSGDYGATDTGTVSGSTFSGNSAVNFNGGAIDNGDDGGMGTLNVSSSTFSANGAGNDGGALDNGDDGGTGVTSLNDSTFYDNTAVNLGGAIDNGSGSTGTLTATASTFSGNTAALDGGTIASGENSGVATVSVAADIFDGSCAAPAGAWNDEGYNVGSDASCFSATPASTDNDSAGAGLGSLLGSLSNNGGPTQTLLPLPGNPALSIVPDGTSVNLNGTSATLCPTTDQRGVASEPGQPCDAGSVQEGQPVALAQSFSTTEGTELTEPAGTLESGVVDFNPGASSWTAQLTATATNGAVVVDPDGLFTYTPDAGFGGTASFSYTLTDNLGYVSAPATVTLMVSAPPVTTTTTIPTATTLTATTTTLTSTAAPPGVSAPVTATTATTTTTSPPKPFPHSGQSYPNGAIVSFSGHDYVFAGGRAFAASTSQLAALEKVDHAKVTPAPAGTSAPTSTTPRTGTLLATRPVNGNATVYVTGAGGELHGFSTGQQFFHDGYDPTQVVVVPSLDGLKVGPAAGAEGAAGSALATRADGAVVDSSGTFYVLAGGKAFGISSASALERVQTADQADVLKGSVGATLKGAAVARGALLSAPGTVYVSYAGALYPFKTSAQVGRDGYGGTAAVPVPGTGAVGVVSSYSGS